MTDKSVPTLLTGYTGGSIVTPVLDREKVPLLDVTFDISSNITVSFGEILNILGTFCAVVAVIIAICGLFRGFKQAKQRKRRKEDES